MVSTVETNPADFAEFAALHALLRAAFSAMDNRIDPPSSMTRLGIPDIAAKARAEDLFLIRASGAPVACLFGTQRGDAYHLGKMAVAEPCRGRGLARRLVDAAAVRASAAGLAVLELQSRVELVETHAAFRALGFVETARTSHAGFDRPTSVTFRKALDRGRAPPLSPAPALA